MRKHRMDKDLGHNPVFTNEVYTDAEHVYNIEKYNSLSKYQAINHLEEMIKIKDERILVLNETIKALQDHVKLLKK